ncbi:TPA: hypothetical protein OUD88_002874 [Enterobacter hormaechei]|nr:hypothetical protein [Enterobacter hormaechei]
MKSWDEEVSKLDLLCSNLNHARFELKKATDELLAELAKQGNINNSFYLQCLKGDLKNGNDSKST